LLFGNPLDLEIAEKQAENSFWGKFTFMRSIVRNKIKESKMDIPLTTPLYDIDKIAYNLKNE
jgi:hypothetical protein